MQSADALSQGQSVRAAAPARARASRRRCCVAAAAAAPKRRVVVTGLGCITSLGHDKNSFYKCVLHCVLHPQPVQRSC